MEAARTGKPGCLRRFWLRPAQAIINRRSGRWRERRPVRGRYSPRSPPIHLVHLAAGNVTIVSTDHVSWSEDRKTDPNMLKNASGIPGLEALYGLLLKGSVSAVPPAGNGTMIYIFCAG